MTAKKQKIGLAELAVVAEQELGIQQSVAQEETPKAEITISQIQKDVEIEFAYLQNQIETTQANVLFMVGRYASAQKCVKAIKTAHSEMARIRVAGEKQLLELEHNLLGGTVIWEGAAIPKLSRNSDVVNRIEMYKRQVAAANTRVATLYAHEYGFENADEAFALLTPEKETNGK